MALLKSLFKGPKVRPSGTQCKTTNILRIYCNLSLYIKSQFIHLKAFTRTEPYSEPCQISKMERFVKIANLVNNFLQNSPF